jgi:predicted transcriptional regulator
MCSYGNYTPQPACHKAPSARARKNVKSGDVVVSIRLSREVLGQIDETAGDQERSRANVLARAVREYAEQEHARLVDLREAERELNEGRGISHEQMGEWLGALRAGKGRPEPLK